MKTYVADIIPQIQRFSQKLDDLTKLTNQHWVSIGDIENRKRVYIFRKNNQLLISDNGVVQRGTWEYLGNESLLMDTSEGSYLFKHGFFDQNIIALKLDSTNDYAFFVNENKFGRDLNCIEDIFRFLTSKYLTTQSIHKLILEKEQKEWMKNPERCLACGFFGVSNKSHCPDCGLFLG